MKTACNHCFDLENGDSTSRHFCCSHRRIRVHHDPVNLEGGEKIHLASLPTFWGWCDTTSPKYCTLQGNHHISHLGEEENHRLNTAFKRGYVRSVPRRVTNLWMTLILRIEFKHLRHLCSPKKSIKSPRLSPSNFENLNLTRLACT